MADRVERSLSFIMVYAKDSGRSVRLTSPRLTIEDGWIGVTVERLSNETLLALYALRRKEVELSGPDPSKNPIPG